MAGDSEQAQAVKVVARAHQTLIWERTRTFQRLRSTLREYFAAALAAYADLTLTSTDALELLIKAPTPATAATLTRPQITAVLARARRHNRDAKAATIQAALRERQLGLPEPVTAAYAAAVGMLASNAVGLLADSLLFLKLAFDSLNYLPGQILGRTRMTLAAVTALTLLLRAKSATT